MTTAIDHRELLWHGRGEGYQRTPDVYGERVEHVRFIGRCLHAGCRTRAAINATVFRVWFGKSPLTGALVKNNDGVWLGIEDRFYGREYGAASNLRQLGLACEEHNEPLKMRRVKARLAPEVKCTSRCHNATSDTCDCECNGTRHGESWSR